jgi:hypothetical protein
MTPWRVVVLENEYLSCRVMPDLGGHLHDCSPLIPLFVVDPASEARRSGVRTIQRRYRLRIPGGFIEGNSVVFSFQVVQHNRTRLVGHIYNQFAGASGSVCW